MTELFQVSHLQATRPVGKLAYLCSQYPAISHTFILREVNALRGLGLEIDTFSIHRTGTAHLLTDVDRVAFETTHAILPPRWTRLLGIHLKLALSAPKAYVSTLALALGLAQPGLRGRMWQVFYFIESVMLWAECRRRGIRHIHVHLANVAADVALLAAELGSRVESGQPWSWSFTMHGPTEFFDVTRFRLAEKLRFARFVVCISDFARSQLMAVSDPATWYKLHVVHCGVPVEQFTGSLHDGREDNPMILCVGRLVPEKGQAVLLQAVAILVERGHQINVTLAGEGPSRLSLEGLTDEHGIASRITFLGAVGQDDIHTLYSNASIFCLPSFAEGIPIVLMEAMTMRVPVVSSCITGIPELIDDGCNGLLVTPGRADELAAALERLLADPALCREMGSAAREKVIREFNTESSAAQLHALFKRQLAPETSEGTSAT